MSVVVCGLSLLLCVTVVDAGVVVGCSCFFVVFGRGCYCCCVLLSLMSPVRLCVGCGCCSRCCCLLLLFVGVRCCCLLLKVVDGVVCWCSLLALFLDELVRCWLLAVAVVVGVCSCRLLYAVCHCCCV